MGFLLLCYLHLLCFIAALERFHLSRKGNFLIFRSFFPPSRQETQEKSLPSLALLVLTKLEEENLGY